MDDRDYFDLLYQGWTKTTGAEDMFWMPEEYPDHSGRHRVYAVAQDESRKLIASDMTSEDSSFLIAMHGSFQDLYRRIHEAVDEADRLDLELDNTLLRVARLEQEADEFEAAIKAQSDLIEQLESGRV